MPEHDTTFIPIAWIGKPDLLRQRPDLQAEIEALSEQELDHLARKVGDGLQPFYASVILEVLAHRFGDVPE